MDTNNDYNEFKYRIYADTNVNLNRSNSHSRNVIILFENVWDDLLCTQLIERISEYYY